MRYIALVLVCLVVSACGKNGPNGEPWPASIVGINGVSETEQTTMLGLIADINERAGKTILDHSNKELPYTITIVKVSAEGWKSGQAGFATRDGEECTIELAEFLFKSAMKDYLASVFFHEVGHCAGLTHSTEPKSIMNAVTDRFPTYSDQALSNFFASLTSAAGL